MEEAKCWIDVNGNSHLKKNDCITAEMIDLFDKQLGNDIDDIHIFPEIVSFIIKEKKVFINYLTQHVNFTQNKDKD